MSAHSASRTVAMAFALAAAFAPACDAPSSSVCVDDDTLCDDGFVCAFGLCVDANDLATVDLEVEPGDPNIPTQAVFDVDARTAAGARVAVFLNEPASISGRVVDDAGGVDADVHAVPARAIAGRVRTPSATTDERGAFALTVLDDASYDLVVDSDAYPPLALDDVVAGSDLDDGVAVDAVDFIVFRGRVVNGDNPEGDMEVFVEEGGRRVSTRAVTVSGAGDNHDDDGRFVVAVRAVPATSASLVLTPRVPGAQPTVRVPLDTSGLVAGADVDVGDLSLASGQNSLVVGVVTRAGAPVEGAVVTLDGLVGAGRVTVRAQSDRDGVFRATVVAGVYEAAVVPPAQERAGLLVSSLDLSSARDDVVLELPRRVRARAHVESAEGAPVAGASVTFQRVGDEFGVVEPVLDGVQPAFLSAADESGNAEVLVDLGRYRVSVTPPQGSGVPAFSTLVTIDGPFARTFTLPQLRVLAGVVNDKSGGLLPGAFVRVFSRLTDERGQALFLGEAVCGADGAFAVSVPALD